MSADDLEPAPHQDRAGAAPRPYRAGAPWRPGQDDDLITGLLTGLTVDALAEAHGRTASAISGRLSKMVPEHEETAGGADGLSDGPPRSRGHRVAWLRERLLAEPGYDWRSPLAAALGPYQRVWTVAEDALLHRAWELHQGLPEVAAALQVEEHVVVRRLTQLGLAEGVVDATDRLGFTPGSVAGVRRSLALDAARTKILVLVLLTDQHLHHISAHVCDEDAEAVRDRIVAELRQQGSRSEVLWSLAWRQVEAVTPSGGRTRTGVFRLSDGLGGPIPCA